MGAGHKPVAVRGLGEPLSVNVRPTLREQREVFLVAQLLTLGGEDVVGFAGSGHCVGELAEADGRLVQRSVQPAEFDLQLAQRLLLNQALVRLGLGRRDDGIDLALLLGVVSVAKLEVRLHDRGLLQHQARLVLQLAGLLPRRLDVEFLELELGVELVGVLAGGFRDAEVGLDLLALDVDGLLAEGRAFLARSDREPDGLGGVLDRLAVQALCGRSLGDGLVALLDRDEALGQELVVDLHRDLGILPGLAQGLNGLGVVGHRICCQLGLDSGDFLGLRLLLRQLKVSPLLLQILIELGEEVAAVLGPLLLGACGCGQGDAFLLQQNDFTLLGLDQLADRTYVGLGRVSRHQLGPGLVA